jgi:UDP-N-acetylglucosamine 2-epimerase
MKVAIVLGTRPEIIKMSPIIRVLEKKNIRFTAS